MERPLRIAFFGTPDIAVWVLEELQNSGIVPALVVTNPNRKQGRGLHEEAPPVKKWADEHGISVFQPENLNDRSALAPLCEEAWDLFVVVAYGQIMPKWLIELPAYGTLNVHPSLLPKLRGASPIRTSILEGMKDTGVTIMLMDEKMDHGPILAQLPFLLEEPILGRKLDATLAKMGGELLASTIPKWVANEITPTVQDHTQATYSKKITKEMGQLQLDPLNLPCGKEAQDVFLKICAFDGNPGTYFFYNQKRIKIVDALLADSCLQIKRVVPEGKKEMDFAQFLLSIR